jgi:dTDP-4-dehydrorhamnose reductase
MFGHDMFNVLYDSYDVVGKGRREVDVTLFSDVSRSITSLKPDFVVNASGYTRVDDAEEEKEEAFQVNSLALKNISAVPINAYGESKLEGEKEVIASGCNYLIIRTQWLFGPQGRNFVFAIVDKLKKTGEVTVVDDQYGCPTYTLDLAHATEKLLRRNQRGIFNFSGEGVVSWFGFACKIAEFSVPEEVRVIPIMSTDLSMKARRPRNSVLTKEKYKKVVGENPRHWEEMLRDFLRRTYEGGVAW